MGRHISSNNKIRGIDMFIEERHQEILNTIKDKGRISIGEIQEKFDVSVDSARRDLRILEEKGLLKRTHGGAIPIMQVGMMPPVKWNPREIIHVDENCDAIAKRAVKYISENDIVYLTSASLGYIMCRYLPSDIHFTVVTNSVVIADELKYSDNITLYIVGGKVRQHGSVVDAYATKFVKELRFDVCFMTGAGFSFEFGLSTGTPETAVFQQTVIHNSRKKIALFPDQKIGFNAFVKVSDVNMFDILITDWDAAEEELTKIQDLGIDVIVVEKEE